MKKTEIRLNRETANKSFFKTISHELFSADHKMKQNADFRHVFARLRKEHCFFYCRNIVF